MTLGDKRPASFTAMRRWLGLLVIAGTLLAACGSDGETAAPPASTSTSAATATTVPEDAKVFFVAEATGPTIDIYDEASGGEPVRTLARADEISGRLVFLQADETTPDRIQVYLPVRPNGSVGWVDRADVSLSSHSFFMEIHLADHRLEVFDGSRVVLDTAIGVGTTDTPTPGGVFFIKELLQPPSPNGDYGTYAYGLSGFSTVLETFNGGNGVIGVHGTNDPSSIGTDVSHGCIRMVNEDIEMLVEDIGLPLGTPVSIIA